MEEFVTFEIAQKLKEKGFKEPCFGWYYPSDVSGYDYRTLIMSNRSTCRGDRYKDLLISHYDDKYIDAPTISQVLKWMRNEMKINIEIFLYNRTYSYFIKSVTHIDDDDLFHQCLNEDTTDEEHETYEEAALAGIEYVLNNII